jgi:hypothetical protein
MANALAYLVMQVLKKKVLYHLLQKKNEIEMLVFVFSKPLTNFLQ